MHRTDILIIGAGIVGLATAWKLKAFDSSLQITIIEKEPAVALHQTGRNSGVIHSGIYYTPGSLKAQYCVQGREELESFCDQFDIPWTRCGKVIVASDIDEASRLANIQSNGEKNGVFSRYLTSDELRDIEPFVTGYAAVHVPCTSIVNYQKVAQALAEKLADSGVQLVLGQPVTHIETQSNRYSVKTPELEFSAAHVINCAGLYADRIAAMTHHSPELQIVPFRGEYYTLRITRKHLCRGLIYPVPDPRFPFLGVHLTRTVGGNVVCGPNAVMALAREGYSWGAIKPGELFEMFRWRGLRKLAFRNMGYALGELSRSVSKRRFAAALRRLVPDVHHRDLVRASAGVRAQALDPNGNLIDDFVICGDEGITHVCNAPSPAATSSLAIGTHIARRVMNI